MPFNPLQSLLAGQQGRQQFDKNQAQQALAQASQQPGFNQAFSPEAQQVAAFSANPLEKFATLDKRRQQVFFDDAAKGLALAKAGKWEQLTQLAENRTELILKLGGDTADTDAILNAVESQDFEGATALLQSGVDAGVRNGFLKEAGGAATTQGKNRRRLFEIIEDPNTPEYQKQAARIELNIEAPVRLSKDERVAKDKALGEAIATQKANEKFATASATSRQKHIDDGVKIMSSLRSSLSNFDKAIGFIDSGAGTGPISKMLPSFRSSTVKLESLKKTMGLDVINSVTFGALSAPELVLAQDIAIDMNLQPQDLKANLLERKAAQEKLYNYLMEQVDYLDSVEGASIPKFLRMKRRGLSGAGSGQQQTQPAIQGGSGGSGVGSLSDEDLFKI